MPAAYALMAQTFKPAVCGGSPCAMQFAFHVVLTGPAQEGTPSDLNRTIPHFGN